MRKFWNIAVITLLLMGFVACGVAEEGASTGSDSVISESDKDSSTNSDSQGQDESDDRSEEIAVDQNLLSVDVKLPGSWFEDMSEEEIISSAKENGISSVEVHEDGSVTYTMSKKKHKELLDEMKVSVEEFVGSMLNGEDEVASFTEITFNDDFSEFNVMVDSSLYSEWDSLSSLGFYMMGGYYQVLAGMEESSVIVNFIDKDSGEIIESANSANLETDDSSSTDESIEYNYNGEFNFKEVVIVDDDNIAITVTEYDPKGDWGATFTLLLENKTEVNVMFSADDVSVNGIMLDPFWAESVAPGKKAYSDISWYQSNLKSVGINYIEIIEGIFSASDADDWSADDIFSELVTLNVENTGVTIEPISEVKFSNGFEELVLVDNEYVKVLVKDFDENGDWGQTFTLYLENHTDKSMMFSADDVSVNGFMIDPFWATSVVAGKSSYGEMSWYDDNLEENKIDVIEEVEFTLRISEEDNWSADDIINETYTINLVK